MNVHQIREENAVLRARLMDFEQKLGKLADFGEKQCNDNRELRARYDALEAEFNKAQDIINSQAQLIYDRDNAINQLRAMLEAMRKDQVLQANLHSDEAKKLQADIDVQHKQFLDTLNKLSQAKAPAKYSFELQNELLQKREKEVNDLKTKLADMTDAKNSADQALKDNEEFTEQLSHEREALRKLNEQLLEELRDAKSGRQELMEIEELKVQLDKEHQKILALHRQKKHMSKQIQLFQQKVQERDSIIDSLNAERETFIDKATEYEGRIQELNNKLDERNKRISKFVQNEKSLKDKMRSYESQAEAFEKQIAFLEEEKERLSNQNNIAAGNRIKKLKAGADDKLKARELAARVREEMEKRLDAEELSFKLKEENASLKKANALLQEEAAEARGADVDPLIELLRDLRVEAVAIDGDLLRELDEIPETRPLEVPEVPGGLCESAAAVVARAAAVAAEAQIENRELRVIVERLARVASVYHRVSSTLARYPVLGIDDVGCGEERGNWVLPVDTEHLQRTVVKLHEILSRRRQSA